ncbi:MAG: STM4013/SEN3800 family hydrolase [Myxococcales bacterium]|nr:STM4013/SEN3800 family hydrolase [Myxococcales bacterium]
MQNTNSLIGSHDILLVTLDTLRYEVAVAALASGQTPSLARYLPDDGWERRHTSGGFTYSAHHAFLAGFLPTPAEPGLHPRLFALRFEGSETIDDNTCVLDGANLVEALSLRGYHTACVGGVGFFNKRTPLGCVLPNLFAESHWSVELGVTNPRSTEHQLAAARSLVERTATDRRIFMLLNVSALHQPNRFYLEGAVHDSPQSMAAALAYVDGHLGAFVEWMRKRAPLLLILTSDHGTAYGEDGYVGHRHAHPVVWTVPYAEAVLERLGGGAS